MSNMVRGKWLVACGALLLVVSQGALAEAQRPSANEAAPASSPRKHTAPAAVPPPNLPDRAPFIVPATFDVRILVGAGAEAATRTQVVTRTARSVHVDAGNGRQWLYLANPVDPRRVSGTLIDHERRTLVSYEESDLRNAFGIRGWLDILALGFDTSVLQVMDATGERRSAHGMVFSRHTARRPETDTRDVWWNPEELVPLEVVKGDASGTRTVQISVQRILAAVDERLLEPPASRFPDYRRVDYADWLEGLSER